jgi:site-specific recombinase XerC
LVVGYVIEVNPSHSVRGPKHVVKKGKTPVLAADEARILLDSIDTSTVMGLRDRALIALMAYTFRPGGRGDGDKGGRLLRPGTPEPDSAL